MANLEEKTIMKSLKAYNSRNAVSTDSTGSGSNNGSSTSLVITCMICLSWTFE